MGLSFRRRIDPSLDGSAFRTEPSDPELSTDPLGPVILADPAAQDPIAYGMTPIIICPIGFVSAHVEVLYDLDIEAKEQAKNLGIELIRTPMLDDSEAMVDILADLAVPNYIRPGVDRGGRQVDRQDYMRVTI